MLEVEISGWGSPLLKKIYFTKCLSVYLQHWRAMYEFDFHQTPYKHVKFVSIDTRAKGFEKFENLLSSDKQLKTNLFLLYFYNPGSNDIHKSFVRNRPLGYNTA